MKFLPFLFLLGAVGAASEEGSKIGELVTRKGVVYRDVTIRKVEADCLAISHESGLARIPYEDLDEDLRGKLGFDPDKARIAREANKRHQAEQLARMAEEEVRVKKAVPWWKRCELMEVKGDDVEVRYMSKTDLAAEVRKMLENELRPEEEIRKKERTVPPGGRLIVKVYRHTLGGANAENFTLVIRDKTNREIMRRRWEYNVGELPGEKGMWWNLMTETLDRELEVGDTVSIVDAVGDTRADFAVIQKK